MFKKINFNRKIQDLTLISKRSSSQKNLNLSPTQRLDNLIQGSTNDLVVEGKKRTFSLNKTLLFLVIS